MPVNTRAGPRAGHGQRLLHALPERGGGTGVGVVALDCEGVELLERAIVVGLLPRSA